MAFHDVLFPLDIALGASGGPERRTEIVTLGSGHEERNTPWAGSRRRYNAGYGLKALDDIHTLIAFFEARQGRLHGFRWRDRVDCKSCLPGNEPHPDDQTLGVGDGERTTFQLVKAYRSGGAVAMRDICKPVAGSVSVAVEGRILTPQAEFSVDHARGTMTLNTAPIAGRVVTAGFRFDVPVRFDTDFLDINLASFSAGSVPDIPVIEIRTGAA